LSAQALVSGAIVRHPERPDRRLGQAPVNSDVVRLALVDGVRRDAR
jgi:hypothetical protein